MKLYTKNLSRHIFQIHFKLGTFSNKFCWGG